MSAMPWLSSQTETVTCTPSRAAVIQIGEDSGACRGGCYAMDIILLQVDTHNLLKMR